MTDSAGTPGEPEPPAGDPAASAAPGRPEPAPADNAPGDDNTPGNGATSGDGATSGNGDTSGDGDGAAVAEPPGDGETPEDADEAVRSADEDPAPEGAGTGESTDEGDGEHEGESQGRSRLNRSRPWLRWAAFGSAFLVMVAAGLGWWLYRKLDDNITTDTTAADELRRYEKERPSALAPGARNILLIGSDTRSGDGNTKYGRDKGTQRSDTTILLHLAADRGSATAVSVPRDLMVHIPRCRTADGSRSAPRFAQFNGAFESGGTACTIRTVEKLTGIRIDHHMVIDFRGFKDMVDAVGGVRVCVEEPIDDPDAHLRLKAGAQTLNGEQALGYVRARKSLGNGSDTERMDRQQRFLGALINKVQSNGVLLNPARLYPVLDAATKSITTDPGLDSLKDLYDLARVMRSVPTEKVQFLTLPRRPYSADPNRDEVVRPAADRLFARLRQDAPVAVVPARPDEPNGPSGRDDLDGGASSSPSAVPTFTGTNAARGTCR
ncbi:LCP family protein [Streptomyces sp. NPDC047928]|uniref:LCP family protein n=1 Tax=unclassified Streptomyces TaxID=2593676 RepID=UPI003719D1D1